MLVSGVQQSDLVLHTYISISYQILFPYRLLQNIEYSSLCYTVGTCWLSILETQPRILCTVIPLALSSPSWHLPAPGSSLMYHARKIMFFTDCQNSSPLEWKYLQILAQTITFPWTRFLLPAICWRDLWDLLSASLYTACAELSTSWALSTCQNTPLPLTKLPSPVTAGFYCLLLKSLDFLLSSLPTAVQFLTTTPPQ